MSKVLVFGGVNIDQVVYLSRPPKEGETLEGDSIETFLGGKGANQAVAISRLGASVSFVGNVGKDSFGEKLITLLTKENIDLSMLETATVNTGTAVINVFDNSENQIVYIPGANELTNHRQVPKENLKRAKIVVSQMEVNPVEVEKLFINSKKSNCLNILNVAPFKKPSNRLIFNSDILIFNELEFALFTGLNNPIPFDLDRLKQEMKDLNLDSKMSLIVTLGSKGLVFFHKNEITFIKGKTVDAVDTVGSGDCFVGALSYSLLKGNSIRDSCEFANKSAAISVTKKGAAASMPNIGEIKRFFHS